MGINVQLQTESGGIVAEIRDPKMILARATKSQMADTRLLKYLAPWGDAIFNQAQAGDLAFDIAKTKAANPDTPLFDLLTKIEPLAEQLGGETHLYLWFVGD